MGSAVRRSGSQPLARPLSVVDGLKCEPEKCAVKTSVNRVIIEVGMTDQEQYANNDENYSHKKGTHYVAPFGSSLASESAAARISPLSRFKSRTY